MHHWSFIVYFYGETWQLCLYFERQYFQVLLGVYISWFVHRKVEGKVSIAASIAKLPLVCDFHATGQYCLHFVKRWGRADSESEKSAWLPKNCHKEAEKLLRLFGKFTNYKLKKTVEEIYKFQKIDNTKDKMQKNLQTNIRLLIYGLLIKPPLCLASTWECWGAGGVSGLHQTLSFGLK